MSWDLFLMKYPPDASPAMSRLRPRARLLDGDFFAPEVAETSFRKWREYRDRAARGR